MFFILKKNEALFSFNLIMQFVIKFILYRYNIKVIRCWYTQSNLPTADSTCWSFLYYQSSIRRNLYSNLPRHVLKLFGSLLVSWEGEKKGEDRPEGWSCSQFARIHGAHVRPKSSERSYAQAHVLDLRNTRKTSSSITVWTRCIRTKGNRSKIFFFSTFDRSPQVYVPNESMTRIKNALHDARFQINLHISVYLILILTRNEDDDEYRTQK